MTSNGITLPAGYSSCELQYFRSITLGSGDTFRIIAMLDGEEKAQSKLFTSADNNPSGSPGAFTLNSQFDPGGQFGVRLRLVSDGAGVANGVHMDDISLHCYGSPSDDGTEFLNGTSMASPMVAGAAALLLSDDPSLSPSQAKARLLSSVDPVTGLSNLTVSGGRLNAFRALIGDSNPASGGGAPAAGAAAGSTPTSINRRPNTFLRRKPRKTVRTESQEAKVVFRFGSDESGSSFRCRLSKEAYASCPRKLVRYLQPGRYVMKVKAIDGEGAMDSSPAVARFRVKSTDG